MATEVLRLKDAIHPQVELIVESSANGLKLFPIDTTTNTSLKFWIKPEDKRKLIEALQTF